MDLLRLYADVARGFLLEKTDMQKRRTNVKGLHRDTQAQLDRIADRVFDAYKNPIIQSYTLEEVLNIADSKVANKDNKLRETFGVVRNDNEARLPLVDKPAVHLDANGTVIGWYLPSLFSPQVSEDLMESISEFGSLPNTVLEIKKNTDNWRYDPASYRAKDKCSVPPGHVVLAPLWFELGHDHTNSLPAPSVTLRDEEGGGGDFIENETHTMALLGSLLALVHPDLFEMQYEVLRRLNTGTHKVKVKHQEAMHGALEHWSSPFTGLAVISNRETPFHRDLKGGKLLYDLVATFGNYKGGTAFLLPGYLFEHGSGAVDGDRICLAHFIKPNVGYAVYHKYKEIPPPTADFLRGRYGLVFDK